MNPLTPAAQHLADDGYLLLPAFAEPHAHLDKAFLAERVENPTGDLLGAIVAMEAARGSITVADTIERAERAARLLAANGCTAIRTHVDLTLAAGLTSVEALIEVRDRLRDLVEIQVVALCAWPSIGPEGAEQRALLREAIAMGIDVVGGCPHLESDPAAANDGFLTLAAEADCRSTCTPTRRSTRRCCALEDLAERVIATGFPHRVAASHCVSLSLQSEHRQREVAEKVAAAGISRDRPPPHQPVPAGPRVPGRDAARRHRCQGVARRRRQRRGRCRQPAGPVQSGRPGRPAGDRRPDDHDRPRAAGRRARHGQLPTPGRRWGCVRATTGWRSGPRPCARRSPSARADRSC